MMINFCPNCGAKMGRAERMGQMRPVCPACGYIHFFDPKVAAAVFITSGLRTGGERVLLIKRGVNPQKGKWALPAGYVDRGEDPRQTAIREAREETGLEVVVTDLADVFYNSGRTGLGADIVLVYAAEITGGALQPSDDAEAVEWFEPDALPDLAFESTRILIANWAATDNTPRGSIH